MTDFTKPHEFDPSGPISIYCKCDLMEDNPIHISHPAHNDTNMSENDQKRTYNPIHLPVEGLSNETHPTGSVGEKVEERMNETQKEMLRQMLEWDDDYRYGYAEFEGIDIKILKKEMKRLRELGFVEMGRGGLNDEGEITGGTGFWIIYEKRNEVKKIVGGLTYEH